MTWRTGAVREHIAIFLFIVAAAFAIAWLMRDAEGAAVPRGTEAWCAHVGGELEYRLADGTRVDCLSARHAWEVDPSARWHECIAQAIVYAVSTGRTPGCALQVGPGQCELAARHAARAWVVVGMLGVEAFPEAPAVVLIGEDC